VIDIYPLCQEEKDQDVSAESSGLPFGVWSSLVLLGLFTFFQVCLLHDHIRLMARNKTFIGYLHEHSNPFMVGAAAGFHL